MKQAKPRSSATTRIISVSGLAIFVLGSMLWEIVSAYIRGGSDAPTVGILIAAVLVLGGGLVFAVCLILRNSKVFLPSSGQEQTSPTDSGSHPID